jgi:hypothetical protein
MRQVGAKAAVMIRFLLRLLGLALLLSGFIAGVLDGVRWLAAGVVDIATLGRLAQALFPTAFPGFGPAVSRNIHPFLWDYGLEPALGWPAFVVLGGLGIALMWLGRKPPPVIGFAPRG